MKKTSSKFVTIILLVVLLLFIQPMSKSVRRLFRIPQTFDTIENQDSELLHLLLDPSSFTKDWQWDGIITIQKDHGNNNPNVQDWTNRQLVGYHNAHDVMLFQTITMYRQPVNDVDAKPLASAIGMPNYANQIPISLPRNSTFLPSVCYTGVNQKGKPVTECVLVRQYNSIHEKISFVIYGDADIQEVSEVIQNMVMYLDEKEVSIP